MKQTRIFTQIEIDYLCNNYTELHGVVSYKGILRKTYINKKGYLKILLVRSGSNNPFVGQKVFKIYVHRLVWILHYKKNPDIVDHIIHDILNNDITNLRNVSHGQNALHMKGSKKVGGGKVGTPRTSVYMGVTKRGIENGRIKTPINPWRAKVNIASIEKTIGHYSTELEAAKARDAYIRTNAPANELQYYYFNFPE